MKQHIVSCTGILVALAFLFEHQRVFRGIDWLAKQFSPSGYVVDYYRNNKFEEILARRGERHLLKDYGEKRPALGVPRTSYAAQWHGWLNVPETSRYSFFIQSIGGTRFFVDEQLVVDHGDAIDWYRGKHGEAHLTAGVYRVRLEHVKTSERGAVRLRWAGGPIPANTVLGAPYVTKERP